MASKFFKFLPLSVWPHGLLVGRFMFFRCYYHPYLCRVNLDTQKIEYVELPIQVKKSAEASDKNEFYWFKAGVKPPPAYKEAARRYKIKHGPPISFSGFVATELINSRGIPVWFDRRSIGSGWGHTLTPVPTVAGDYLYIPSMNGTVYVITWNADLLNGSAIVSVNDLGETGHSWTRASGYECLLSHWQRADLCR